MYAVYKVMYSCNNSFPIHPKYQETKYLRSQSGTVHHVLTATSCFLNLNIKDEFEIELFRFLKLFVYYIFFSDDFLPIFMIKGIPEPQPLDTNELLSDDDLSFTIVQVTLLSFLGTNSKLLCNSGLQKGSEDSNVCVAGDCISLIFI
jgi:hypothetical protein